MKKRIFEESNYLAIFHEGKTVRFQIDDDIPVGELKFPEFYDVKITNFCEGNCPYCYQDSGKEYGQYYDAVPRIKSYFATMKANERPFQVAIGGGNPNQHPDFVEILKLFHDLDIVPNYTTNGMGLTKEVLEATKEYCGGVAVSCHPHLPDYWSKAVLKLTELGVHTNLHLIISDQESILDFENTFHVWNDIVSHFVLLPYTAQGRAEEKEIDFKFLTEILDKIPLEQVAFGAGFYDYLLTKKYPVSLYEPEIFSGYLDIKDMVLYKSSFDLTPKGER